MPPDPIYPTPEQGLDVDKGQISQRHSRLAGFTQYYENTAEDKLWKSRAAEDALMETKLPRMLTLPSCVADIRRNGQSQPTHHKAGEGAEATGEGDRAVGDKATHPTANQSKEGATTAPGDIFWDAAHSIIVNSKMDTCHEAPSPTCLQRRWSQSSHQR